MKPTHMRKTKKKKQNRGKATGVGLSVFFFIAGYQGGIGTLFFVFINELLPAEVKDIGFIYASTLQWVCDGFFPYTPSPPPLPPHSTSSPPHPKTTTMEDMTVVTVATTQKKFTRLKLDVERVDGNVVPNDDSFCVECEWLFFSVFWFFNFLYHLSCCCYPSTSQGNSSFREP
eukprot:TRINITY_DN10758_c0_g1_i4.p1 TRINITY_DN10758_c0_g1~~TRINITY_DN10758_c0_g1_i4.p1  ORF type:complete len:173 (-),score=29.63 TRINITY_DN10758_c0_g1_i4:263-781(-)